MCPTRKYVQNAQLCPECIYFCNTSWQEDCPCHVVCFVAKRTTSNGTWSSYVKCGPTISKVLRMKTMTLKNMTPKWQGGRETQGNHLVWMRIRLRKNYTLPRRGSRNKSDLQQHKDIPNHRISINWRSDSKKNQFLTPLLNDKFSQDNIFHYWDGCLSGHAHVDQTYPDVVRMWRQYHGCPESGVGIERVFFSAGNQHDALKGKTMDKPLENTFTLKATINSKLPTCDDKGVFIDDDDWHIQEEEATYGHSGRRLVGDRVRRRRLWVYSVALVGLVSFVSKRFVNEVIKWLEYQSNIQKDWLSKGLIIKPSFLNISVWLSKGLIIKPKSSIIKSINLFKSINVIKSINNQKKRFEGQ